MVENKSNKILEKEIQTLKKKNKSLLEAQKALEFALDAADIGSWIYDIPTDLITIDSISEKILGFKPKSNTEWDTYIHPDDINKAKDADAIMDSSRTIAFESKYRMITKKGIIKWILDRGKVVQYDKEGKPTSTAGIIYDITERKQHEEKLKESQERTELALKGAELGMWDWNIDKDKFSFDMQSEDLLGPTPVDIEEWYARVHPDDLDRVKKYDAAIIRGENGSVNYDYRMVADTGEVKWIHAWGKVLKWSEKGRPIRASGTSQDITQQKITEQALEDSRERMELALMGADLGMWDYTIKTEDWNFDERSIKMLGANPRSDAEFNELLHPDDIMKYHDTWKELEEDRKPFYVSEYRIKMPSGQYKWFKDKGKTVERDSNGKPVRIAGTTQNITIQKQAEKERATLVTQLQQSQKMESIGTLAGGIAHDFNNILSGIFGYSQLAQAHLKIPEKASQDIEQILKGAKRAADLVQQILTFSRQTEYQKHPLKIYMIVSEALKLLRASIPSTIEIVKKIDSKSVVYADPIRIHQIVMNLCTNAYHAMRETGGSLTVSLTDVDVLESEYLWDKKIIPGEYIKFEVSDTGIGMDENELDKAFEPYFTTKGLGEGTGLGLALVHAIVDEHDSFLNTFSKPGKGTIFSIYFPILKPDTKNHGLKLPKDFQIKGNERIMIVDDEESIRHSCSEYLRSQGYKVDTFNNGVDALKKFKVDSTKFDLIITDLTMPGLPGDKLAKEILKIQPEIPIILSTGYCENMTETKVIELGIKKLVHKPILSQDLTILIRELLN